jgi:predicted AAA+ superfamily ATPase
MRRKVDNFLRAWGSQAHEQRSILIVRGVRQCGKSYSVIQFLQEEFTNCYRVFNFEAEERLAKAIEASEDFNDLVDLLSLELRTDLRKPQRLALFFDEIQVTPKLIAKLRFFKENLSYLHVLAAGSYLEMVLEEVGSFPVGRVENFFMRPMDFEEFLWALGEEFYTEKLKVAAAILAFDGREKHIESVGKLCEPIHKTMTVHAITYELCGGMPQCIATFIKNRNIHEVRRIQNNLLTSFRADFLKHRTLGWISKEVLEVIDAIFDHIEPLAKRVRYNAISHHAVSTIKSAIQILSGVGLVYKIYFTSAMNSPLSSGKNLKDFRLYMCDTGLFHALVKTSLPPFLNGRLFYSNDGILGEYFLTLSLINASDPSQKDPDVYFWENKKSTEGAELDAVFFYKETLCVFDAKRRKQKVSHSLRFYTERFDAVDSHRPAYLAAVVSSDELGKPNPQKIFINIPFYLLVFVFSGKIA